MTQLGRWQSRCPKTPCFLLCGRENWNGVGNLARQNKSPPEGGKRRILSKTRAVFPTRAEFPPNGSIFRGNPLNLNVRRKLQLSSLCGGKIGTEWEIWHTKTKVYPREEKLEYFSNGVPFYPPVPNFPPNGSIFRGNPLNVNVRHGNVRRGKSPRVGQSEHDAPSQSEHGVPSQNAAPIRTGRVYIEGPPWTPFDLYQALT